MRRTERTKKEYGSIEIYKKVTNKEQQSAPIEIISHKEWVEYYSK